MQKKFYSSQWVDQVKEKNDIVQVISSYINVSKRGGVYWALCPFHHEKTPSFAINEDEQYYHCFGCGEGGNVIKFVQQIESISFPEAVEKLAERAGIEIPQFENGEQIIKDKKTKENVLNALNVAMEIYQNNLYLPVAKQAQEYVKMRNFKKSDLDRFHIGYSNGNTLINELLKKGYSIETLEKAGILGGENNKYYDKLSGRLIFPVLNSYGECVGYSGRILEKSDYKAKYKNTEQTIVFDKSSLVYGLNLLKDKKRNEPLNEIILVEGQIDVIKMHSYGFTSTVASLGTALTEKHANILKRVCDNIIICYDGDLAGQKASLRAIPILEKEGFNIKVARLPNGKDPDEFLRENGAKGMENLLNKAISPIEYKLQLLLEKNDISKPEGKATYLKNAIEIVQQVKTHSERDVYLKIISNESGVPIDILRRDCDNHNFKQNENEEKKVLNSVENGNKKAIKFVLKSVLKGENFAKVDFDLKKYLSNPLYISILNKFEEFKENYTSQLSEEEKNFVLDIFQEKTPGGKEYFDQCIWKIVEDNLKTKQLILNEKFKIAETKEERTEILNELKTIINQLNERKI